MRKFLLLSSCLFLAFGDIKVLPATPANIEKFEQIIDLRVPVERREMGIIKGAKLVDFSKDKNKLWGDISAQIDTSKPFALICRGGRRSKFVAELLDAPGLDITIFDGGIKKLIEQGYITTPYKD